MDVVRWCPFGIVDFVFLGFSRCKHAFGVEPTRENLSDSTTGDIGHRFAVNSACFGLVA